MPRRSKQKGRTITRSGPNEYFECFTTFVKKNTSVRKELSRKSLYTEAGRHPRTNKQILVSRDVISRDVFPGMFLITERHMQTHNPDKVHEVMEWYSEKEIIAKYGRHYAPEFRRFVRNTAFPVSPCFVVVLLFKSGHNYYELCGGHFSFYDLPGTINPHVNYSGDPNEKARIGRSMDVSKEALNYNSGEAGEVIAEFTEEEWNSMFNEKCSNCNAPGVSHRNAKILEKEMKKAADSGHFEAIAGASSLLVCAVCRTARYCTKECQITHWKIHKKVCRRMANQYKKREQKKAKMNATKAERVGAGEPEGASHVTSKPGCQAEGNQRAEKKREIRKKKDKTVERLAAKMARAMMFKPPSNTIPKNAESAPAKPCKTKPAGGVSEDANDVLTELD